MSALFFSVQTTLSQPPDAILDNFFNLDKWSDFKAYGLVPGIVSARFLDTITYGTGSQIRVKNSDGSEHTEAVTECNQQRLSLRFQDFSPPLSRLAHHFEELWIMVPHSQSETRLERRFYLYPKNLAGRLVLSAMVPFLKQAVIKHMDLMAEQAAQSIGSAAA